MGARRAMGCAGWVAALLLLAPACGGDFVAPTTAAECAAAAGDVDGAGSSDVSSGWTIAYSHESRPLGSSGTLFLCVGNDVAATVSSDATAGITVEPDPLTVRAGPELVEELSVTVTAGDEERLEVTLDVDGYGGTIVVDVDVDVDDDEWSFGDRLGG